MGGGGKLWGKIAGPQGNEVGCRRKKKEGQNPFGDEWENPDGNPTSPHIEKKRETRNNSAGNRGKHAQPAPKRHEGEILASQL